MENEEDLEKLARFIRPEIEPGARRVQHGIPYGTRDTLRPWKNVAPGVSTLSTKRGVRLCRAIRKVAAQWSYVAAYRAVL